MIPFALFGALIGAIVGTRFVILTLIPVMTCAVIIGVSSSVLHNSAIGPTIIELAVLLAFIQIGYVCSAALTLGWTERSSNRSHAGRPKIGTVARRSSTKRTAGAERSR